MRNRYYGKKLTWGLWIVFLLLLAILWSLFISGPSRVQEVRLEQRLETIKKETKGVQGLTMHRFDYTTYQGYTETTLYWFNENCDVITTREIETLDYEQAKKVALETYGVEARTIELGYGYDNPVYEIRSKDTMILLDYDSYERVYQREV